MPSLQPGTANEERARRREATRHQEKSRFTNVLRRADASKDTTAAAAPQSRSSETRPKRTGNVRVAQTRDKVAPRPSTRPVDEHPEPDSLKSTVTPVFWDNPLKILPHIYNPSPLGRPANHTPAKPSATPAPRVGGRAQDVTPRSSAESVGAKSSSKRPAVPAVAGSKSASAFTDQSSRIPAAAPPPSSTALPAVQPLSSHLSTTVVQTSTESLPMTETDLLSAASCASSPQKGTRSKAVASTPTTERAGRGMERHEEWHKKMVNMRYPTREEIHQKLVKDGRITEGIHRPPAVKPVEVGKGAKQDKSPVSSAEDLKPTAPSIKGSKTSPLQTGSTESLASRHSSKASRPSTGRSAGSSQVVRKEQPDRADRRGTAKPSVGISQTEVKPSATSARRASPSTREQASIKHTRSRLDIRLPTAPFPAAPPEDVSRDDSSLKRVKKPWDGSTRAEERSEVVQSRLPEPPVNSSRPSGDVGTRASPTLQPAAAAKPHQSAAPCSDTNSIKTVSSIKSSRQHSPGTQASFPSIAESLRTDGSVRKSSHKPSSRNGKTSQSEGSRKRSRTVSNTATVSDAPVSAAVFREDWPTPEELLSDMPSMPFMTTSRVEAVSPIKTSVSIGNQLQAGSVASAKERPSGVGATLGGETKTVEVASSTHQAVPVPVPGSRVDEMLTTTSDASLQPVSRRSSGVSYATVQEPVPQDPPSTPVTLRHPIARQLLPHSPLLHCRFESIVTDNNLCSVVTDNFDIESYPLACDRTPLPSIPVQVASAMPEVIPRAPDLLPFTRGRIEPGWPALKPSAGDLKSVTRSVATVKEVRFTENSSEESLLEGGAHTTHRSAGLSIFPNASIVTVSTSSGSGPSIGSTPLPSSRQSPVPSTNTRRKGKEPAEDPPSYNDSVRTRKRTQSDAADKKDRLLLNARLPAPYIESMFKRQEAYEASKASSSAQADKQAEQTDRARKPSMLKRIVGQLSAPFSFKKKEEANPLALARSVSAQPRASPPTVHWIVSQTARSRK
ncbi:hypothetical protein V8D89_013778 [Ganoderma adspersum]